MKNNNLMAFCLFILILMGVLYSARNTIINHIIDRYSAKSDTIVRTDTILTTDTLTFFKDRPVPYKVETIKTDTLYRDNGDSVLLATENKIYNDTICAQKDTAIIRSYITGINASLDSIEVEMRTTKETITNTVEITKYLEKNKTFWNRFHIQPQATGGYDVINKNWGIVIGIGIGVDI